jgi:hypothetical protein
VGECNYLFKSIYNHTQVTKDGFGDFSHLMTIKPLITSKLLFIELINTIQWKGALHTKYL